MNDSLRSLGRRYSNFVLSNTEVVSSVESSLRWISYFIPSQSRETAILSELVYSASKLLVVINDSIYERYLSRKSLRPLVPEEEILRLLKIFECVEVFIEIAGSKYCGTRGRWLIIAAIQIIKVVCRILLIFKRINRKESVIEAPFPPSLDRNCVHQYLKLYPMSKEKKDVNPEVEMKERNSSFVLKSSGRTMMSLNARNNSGRVNVAFKESHENLHIISSLNDEKFMAELVYTLRPLLHLLSLSLFGLNSWKPWIISCGLDVASIRMLNKCQTLSTNETMELHQRTFLLLLYFIRSPFYSKYSKKRIISLLNRLKRTIPLGNFMWSALLDYAKTWDKIYFYSWGR